MDYIDAAFVYAYQIYEIQNVAEANGFVLERMFLHGNVDFQYKANAWTHMQQFDCFERTGQNYLNAKNGVFTWDGNKYTDVTVTGYDNAHKITVTNTLYVGYMEPFDNINFTIATARAGGSVTYSYWNGVTWNTLAPQSDGTAGLRQSGQVYFWPPSDWDRTTVNGSKRKYWVRIQVTGAATAPVYSRLYGDDWAVAAPGKNGRGWDGTVPECPGNRPNGSPCRINAGTRLEYDANPPSNATARFKYQARVTGVWASTSTYGNPTDVQGGKPTWATYLLSTTSTRAAARNAEGVMFDDMTNWPSSGLITSPTNPLSYTEVTTEEAFRAARVDMLAYLREALHSIFGPNYKVGSNTTYASVAMAGDWAYEESWYYTSYGIGAVGAYNKAGDALRYDTVLPANNPGGTKAYFMCWDTPSALYPGINNGIKAWHSWDRGNRSPMNCLAQHYIGSNGNSGFNYYTEGGFYYSETDEVYTYAPATTLAAPVASNTTSQWKTITLASAGGCEGSTLLRLGTRESGDTVSGSLKGTTFTTNSQIHLNYAAGDPAYCIQKQHQSQGANPPAENVWKWGTWFPSRGVDIGEPDPAGLNGGARVMLWKRGGAPDYISGQPPETCDAVARTTPCADVHRRDFTKAIVLLRGYPNPTLESELDTPSQPIDLGGMYYPLKADGATGPGITSIRLRANESAILMKQPLGPADGVPPLCDAGRPQILRAGFSAQLDGSGSQARDNGGRLSLLWQQVSGPTRVNWSNRSEARPEITGLVFGTYVFQLTVTDASGRSSACTVKHGAVATDGNGVVITDNPAVDILLGPVVRLGANPWPWFDDRFRSGADVQIASMDTLYPAWWETPGPGTIAVEAGSNAIAGEGTTFTTTFCQGPANPTVPKPDAVIAVWYETGAPGETGRRMSGVTGCTDDTHLTVDEAWGGETAASGAGLRYASDDAATHYATNWGWGEAASPANYYDNVAAYYTLYYRTGLEDYLAAARKLADRVWRSPMIDRGSNFRPGHGSRYAYAERSISALGLVLRALELQGTEADMWPGMHRIWDASMAYLAAAGDRSAVQLADTRAKAYHLALVSYCALYDGDPEYRAACKTTAANSFAGVWTPLLADGGWPELFYEESSWDSDSSVSLVRGSQDVTGNGTAWTAGSYPATIWFTNDPNNKPLNNYAGDAQIYRASFLDANHLKLDRSYEGTSGIHGWASAPGEVMLGWGAEPAQIGLLAFAFDLAGKAIALDYPGEAALARQYSLTAANWIKSYGYREPAKGLYDCVGGLNCQPPISEWSLACTGGNPPARARALSAEALRGVMAAYASSQDVPLRAFADTLYNAMFAKPGTCPAGSADCMPDGEYVSGLDPEGYIITDGLLSGNKWFGMFFGFNNLSAWPAYRSGGLQPPRETTLYAGFNLGRVRRAVKTRLTATAPSGRKAAVECSSSPCAITVDRRQGKPVIQLEYLSETGAVLAAAPPF